MIIAIVVAILAINILVLTHESGHFMAAKRCGIVIETFSIGFGPKLFSFTYKGTEYKLSAFLFGGYVKFKGDELEENNMNLPGGFYSASPFKRILVCAAGAFCNIVLASVLYVIISICGKPVTVDSLNTIVGGTKEDSVAEKIGILAGDKILNINGENVDTWEKLVYAIAFSKKDEIDVEIERNGELVRKHAVMVADKDIGIKMLGIYGKETILVDKVLKDSPAENAGLKPKDKIIAVNTDKVYRLEPLIKTIRESEGKEIILTVLRNGQESQIKVIPKKMHGENYAGIGFSPAAEWTKIYPRPWEQFWNDLVRTWQTLIGLITRHIPVRAISGPVGIVGIIGISMQVGWIPLLCIIALISLNLGVVNLLPIPVLDGGHILFNIIEMIRKKSLSIKTIEKIQNVFMVLLIMLAIYATYNDILRFFIRH